MNQVVTIDGPAGSGKSTVACKLAKRLDFIHLNSGALFRSLAVQANRKGIALDDEDALIQLLAELKFQFELSDDGETLFKVNGVDVRSEISTRESGELASQIAIHPRVREVFVGVQREAFLRHSIVVEGRDAGTIVFPDASFKFYLDASVEERAKRRFEQLADTDAQLEEIREDLRVRDERDSTRAIAPQVKAEDAVLVDTTSMTIEEVVDYLVKQIRQSYQDAD